MQIYRIFSFLILFLCAGGFFLHGETNEPAKGIVLEADAPLEYDDSNQTVTASRNAVLTAEGIILNADRITWNRQTSLVRADGSVSLGVVGYRLLAQSLILDLASGTFTAEKVKTGMFPWVAEADQMIANDSNYTLSNVSFRHENHDRFSPSFLIDRTTYDINSTTAIAEGIGLSIDGKTIGRIPKIKRNLEGKEPRIELLGGEEQPLGWYAGVRFDALETKNFSSDIEAISYFDRGIFLGPQFSYFKEDPVDGSYFKWNGTLGGIKDDGDIAIDSRGLLVGQDRGFASIWGVNRWDNHWRMALDLNIFSDSEVYRDYDRDGFEQNQWHNNAFELAYEGEDLIISVSTKWQGNEFQSQAEMLPSVLLTYGPKSLWNKWTYESFQVEYAEKNARNNLGEKGNSYTKFDFGHKTATTFEIAKGLKYTPSLSFRWQTFDIDDANKHTRSFWETGNEISLSMHGDYPWENQVWKTESLRHVMTFSVSHHHVHSLMKSEVPSSQQIEPYFENTNLGPVELLDYLDSDNLSPYEVIRAGWEQELLGQKDGLFTRWADLQFFQDLWVDQDSLLQSVPYFYGQARIYPARWLNLEIQSKIDTDRGETFRNSYGFTILDGITNEISIHYLAYEQLNDNLQSRLFHRIDETKNISAAVRYDPQTEIFPYWSGVLTLQKPAGWEWSVYLSQRRGTDRENELAWGLGVNLFSF